MYICIKWQICIVVNITKYPHNSYENKWGQYNKESKEDQHPSKMETEISPREFKQSLLGQTHNTIYHFFYVALLSGQII